MTTLGSRRRAAVFLDRDGVLNDSPLVAGIPVPPKDLAHFHLLPGVASACARLREAGFALVVVTNQPDIARGRQNPETVAEMHRVLLDELDLDEIYLCPHDDADGCPCRKPASGMITEAAEQMNLDLAGSYLVGDRWRDMEAARRAGVVAIHVDRKYDEDNAVGPTDAVVADLPEAADWIMNHYEGRIS